ncbi:class I SAM-dependent methyltransferase [Roseomonas rosulenta]|uniref:class I SAM-dependent methyltransferase n=1 Tax=Roseomonas rosulenta TaxID=2748667 RepID=UPI0018E0578F|nr:methyltransferase domain-containing protein [Roseomonas rosulenta]
MDLLEQDILGDAIGDHWYYRSKSRAMLRLLEGVAPRSMLDIGAGSGFFARELLARGGAERATCVDPNYPTDRDDAVAGKPLLFRRDVTATDADLLLLMDVLEHVDDDVALLGGYARMAPRGATVLLTVPAFEWLWSGHDVYLGHRRRYTVARLEATAHSAGVAVDRACYFFAGVFPLAAALRLPGALRRGATGQEPPPRCEMRRHGALANALLGAICAAELPAMPFNRLFGLTVFLRGRVA